MAKTNIEWTEFNWNPFLGCRHKSDGCENCYAELIAARFSGTDKNGKVLPFAGIAARVNGKPRWTGEVKLNEEILLEPLKRKQPTVYFVNSMSDTFYENIPDEWIDKLFAVMALCPQHTFQILTKRADRMRDYFIHFQDVIEDRINHWAANLAGKWIVDLSLPLKNVMLGVSVENRKAKSRIELLRQTPSAVRFLSLEPLLEDLGELDLRGIDWVIVGGESGNSARPCNIGGIRSIVQQCKPADVRVFIKQLGARPLINQDEWYAANETGNAPILSGKDATFAPGTFALYTKNKKGGDIAEFPKDLQIREFPKTA